jgi:glycosyltransferase involved in cell wall biosynthesis
VNIAFVSPRWAPRAAGGAEELSRTLAEHLAARGHEVTALATCAENPHTWKNERPAGTETAAGVTVRRFPVNAGRMSREFLLIQERIGRRRLVTRDEEERWIEGSVASDALMAHLEREGGRFDALVFVPYLFGITWRGSSVHPERSLLIPCLHDEPFAYLSIYRDLFSRFRGFLFNSIPEMQLARRLYDIPEDRCFLVSMGFEEPRRHDPAALLARLGMQRPYLLYSGRKEEGKNTHLLLEYFRRFRERRGEVLDLVLTGSGEVALEGADGRTIRDLGFVTEEEKLALMAGCLAFCQPSVNESFSIVLMETWLAGRPVLVHGACAVTRHHVETSGGGLWFEDYLTFEGCLDWLLGHPGECAAMAGQGAGYVRKTYSWDAVLDRFEEAVAAVI